MATLFAGDGAQRLAGTFNMKVLADDDMVRHAVIEGELDRIREAAGGEGVRLSDEHVFYIRFDQPAYRDLYLPQLQEIVSETGGWVDEDEEHDAMRIFLTPASLEAVLENFSGIHVSQRRPWQPHKEWEKSLWLS